MTTLGRMRCRVMALGCLLLWTGAASGQSATQDSVYRQMLGFRSLVKGGSVAPHWMEDGRSFWYLEGGPDSSVALRVDPAANRVDRMLDVDRVRQSVAALTDILSARTAAIRSAQ